MFRNVGNFKLKGRNIPEELNLNNTAVRPSNLANCDIVGD